MKKGCYGKTSRSNRTLFISSILCRVVTVVSLEPPSLDESNCNEGMTRVLGPQLSGDSNVKDYTFRLTEGKLNFTRQKGKGEQENILVILKPYVDYLLTTRTPSRVPSSFPV